MKNLFESTLAFALLSFGSASTVYLEYYKDYKCASSSLSAVTLSASTSACSACKNLDSPAKSFHVGAPASEKQVPDGCEIIGYSDKGCKGAINVQIQGPSDEGTCYHTGKPTAPVESVRLLCL